MDNSKDPKKVTLDIEMQDLVDIVSKVSSGRSISSSSTTRISEGEDLRKAWFKHMFISVEKLNDLIEDVRRIDIPKLRDEISIRYDKVDNKVGKLEDKFLRMSNKLSTLTGKISVWALLGGCIGSGVIALVVYLLKILFESLVEG